jgi:hypothetical protein
VIFVAVTAVVALGYSILLPFAFTQRLSLHNWHYLDGRYLAFSLAFGLSIGWLLMVQLHALRRVMRLRGAGVGGTAAAIGVLPSLLCCTPIVPTLLGLVGLSGASLGQTSGSIQSFFATKQDLILGTSLAVIVIAGLWSTRRVIRAACFVGDDCDTPDTPQSETTSIADGAAQKSRGPTREKAGSMR